MIFEDENGSMISFNEYLELEETVEPKETEYGTDYNSIFRNKEWNSIDSLEYTFFAHSRKLIVCVVINSHTGEAYYITRRNKSITDDFVDYIPRKCDMRDSLQTFNKFLYVMSDKAKRDKIDTFKLSRNHEHLGVLYDRVVRNKFLISKLKEHGVEYKGKDSADSHVFKTILLNRVV